jgi:hypothetical protein
MLVAKNPRHRFAVQVQRCCVRSHMVGVFELTGLLVGFPAKA